MHHFLIAYIMRLSPFDFFEVRWLNSHIFYELCECKDMGAKITERGGQSLAREKKKQTRHQLLEPIQPYDHQGKLVY